MGLVSRKFPAEPFRITQISGDLVAKPLVRLVTGQEFSRFTTAEMSAHHRTQRDVLARESKTVKARPTSTPLLFFCQ